MIKILKMLRRSIPIAVCGMLLLSACSKSKQSDTISRYDPSKPLTLQRFTPDSGGVGTQMIIYGENFGSDPAIVKVFINDVPAPVVGVKNNTNFVLIPSQAGE